MTNESIVVYEKNGLDDIPDLTNFLNDASVLEIGGQGEYEFGWDNHTYLDFWSKANFAYMQALYLKDTDKDKNWVEMLERVIKKHTGIKEIEWKVDLTWEDREGMLSGYIDHQSASTEGENIEMFESEEALASFLFNRKSLIQTGNDNE